MFGGTTRFGESGYMGRSGPVKLKFGHGLYGDVATVSSALIDFVLSFVLCNALCLAQFACESNAYCDYFLDIITEAKQLILP